MFENQVTTPHEAPARTMTLSAEQMRETIEQLRLVREFIYQELRDGSDFGKVAGCGDKPTLLQPGAQKICMFFNVYPDYEVERRDLGDAHVDYAVKTSLVSRLTGQKVGSGVGSCSSLEKKFRYRQQNRSCPKCGAEAIRSSKAGGFFCGVRSGGCGANFTANDKALLEQRTGLVDNENVADSFNTVLKMAKKRSFVDATLSLSCISEFFTQDLEDQGSLQPLSKPLQEVPAATKTDVPAQARQMEAAPAPAPAPGPVYTPDPSLSWLEHAHVVDYNRRFEAMVTASGLRGTDREPATRSFIKNAWMKLTRDRGLEMRPDLVRAEDYYPCADEWEHTVFAAFSVPQEKSRGRGRSTRARAAA